MTTAEREEVKAALRVDSWLRLRMIDFDHEDLEAVKDKLTVESEVSANSPGESRSMCLYKRDGGDLLIPRQTGFLPPSFLSSAFNCTQPGEDRDFGDPIELRPYQVPVVEKVMASLDRNPYGGILCSAAGSGKTVMALEIMRRVKKTTVILVHKEFLVDQWTKRMLHGDEHSPAFLPNARVGYVQQDQCDFGDDYDVVIAMVQSLVARDYDPEFYKWAGLVCSDEVHRLGAETWSTVISKFPAQTRLGLTATPHRKDGMEPVFFWHIGPIIAEAKREDTKTMKPKVRVINWYEEYPMWKFKLRNGRFNLAKWITYMSCSVERNEMIANQLVKALDKGRKILALSDRREQLNTIAGLVGMKTEGKYTIDQYVGSRKQKDLDVAAKADLVLGTFKMADEALDIPDLDVLVQMTPKSDVEQAVGRVQRTLEGKKDPVVVDIVDRDVKAANGMAGMRRKVYVRLGAKFI